MSGFFGDMADFILDMLRAVWSFIKKIWVRICRFFRNIVSWFKDPSRWWKVKHNRDNLPVVIKTNLANGNYQVCNCLFNQTTEELVDPEADAEVIEAEDLDPELEENFGGKDMLVLR